MGASGRVVRVGCVTNPPWRAVLFDLDGTIANTIPLIIASYRHTLAKHRLRVPDDAEITSWIGRTLHDQFGRLVPAGEVEGVVETYSAWQMAHLPELLTPFEGVSDLLQALADAGVRAGIVTSKRRGPALRTIEHLGLDRWLAVAAAYEDTPRHKPDPAPLLAGAATLGFEPGTTVYVGDVPTDLTAARAAGMAGIGVTWGSGLPEGLRAEPSVAVVDTVPALQAVLLGE